MGVFVKIQICAYILYIKKTVLFCFVFKTDNQTRGA